MFFFPAGDHWVTVFAFPWDSNHEFLRNQLWKNSANMGETILAKTSSLWFLGEGFLVIFLKRRKYHKLRDVKKPETAIFPQNKRSSKVEEIKKKSVCGKAKVSRKCRFDWEKQGGKGGRGEEERAERSDEKIFRAFQGYYVIWQRVFPPFRRQRREGEEKGRKDERKNIFLFSLRSLPSSWGAAPMFS